MRHLIVALVMIAGCGSEGLPAAGDGGGGDGGGADSGSAACNGLSQTQCGQRTDCRVDTCPTCQGGRTFIACAKSTDPQIGCGLDCPAPCSLIPDATSCNARSDCHAVFEPQGACDCAPAGCCIHFDHCADGRPNCVGPAGCDIQSPACDGPYVISYTNTCYEGCVLASECM